MAIALVVIFVAFYTIEISNAADPVCTADQKKEFKQCYTNYYKTLNATGKDAFWRNSNELSAHRKLPGNNAAYCRGTKVLLQCLNALPKQCNNAKIFGELAGASEVVAFSLWGYQATGLYVCAISNGELKTGNCFQEAVKTSLKCIGEESNKQKSTTCEFFSDLEKKCVTTKDPCLRSHGCAFMVLQFNGLETNFPALWECKYDCDGSRAMLAKLLQ